MSNDLWHYPRASLAIQVLEMFESGISNSLVFFAPRRMGKTEFLRKDITPRAEKKGWKVFYFSFLDIDGSAENDFIRALENDAKEKGMLSKTGQLLNRVRKVSGTAGILKAELELNRPHHNNLKEIIGLLCQKYKILFLMDEVQTLAQDSRNATFIASLRTILDTNKETIKVIFTGSSQEGLRRMFSQAKAPFFHFGLNLPFPELDRGFTDHLAYMFHKVTQRQLDPDVLWQAFLSMNRVPQLARTLVERLILNPNYSLPEIKKELMAQIYDDRAFADSWDQCSMLEKLLLQQISKGNFNPFSIQTRHYLAQQIGIKELKIPSIQSSLRVLRRKGLIGRLPEQRAYCIDDPNFKNWLLSEEETILN